MNKKVLGGLFAAVVVGLAGFKYFEKDDVPEGPQAVQTYKVEKGDTLSGIGAEFNASVHEILELNPKIEDPHTIKTGEIIAVPVELGSKHYTP